VKKISRLRNTTLLYLIQESQGKTVKICLAMKKRGFGKGSWNGTGGKVEKNETIRKTAQREAWEEIGVKAQKMEKVAELSFFFPHHPAWNQKVYVYFCSKWKGEPKESQEMKPKWFSSNKLPFKKMWPDDIFWMPLVLKGEFVKATFTFGRKNRIEKKEIRAIIKRKK
jgi:8-oxo-dGTP pyrophosphatase MutT (NUDIX family)